MFRMTNSVRAIALLLITVIITACSAPDGTVTDASPAPKEVVATQQGEQTISAIATNTIIADMVRNVGGERVNVQSLLPPGADPHVYSPTPGDVQAIAASDILFRNGLGLEEWVEEVIANAGGTRPIITVTDGLEAIEGDQHDDKHGDEHHDDEHGHEHGDKDPHMWFDVQKAIGYAENIRNGLKQVDPDGAAIYDENAATYIQQLEELDAEIVEQVETVLGERRKLVTNHDTFGYFANRYGFEIVGTVFEGLSTEQEPSPQQVAQLVQVIQEEDVPAIFAENIANPRLAEQIANEANVEVVTDLYTDALGEPGSSADTYINMMRHNVERIVEALR
jgi:ABC-type Zn uptake system ZnuABC Zn-binding protein ZnuA